MKRRFITAEEAISLLPSGDTIHTFYNCGVLIGGDWDRTGVIEKINRSDVIEITGEKARALGHGLAVYNKDTRLLSDVLFVETDKDKLDAFDSLQEVDNELED